MMFLPALLLLFYPVEFFIPKDIRLKQLHNIDFSESGARRRAPWHFPALWTDGVRACLGAFLLRDAWTLEPMAGWLHHVPVIASVLILILSLAAQMHTRRSEEYFLGPLTYMIGLWLALAPLPVAVVAVAAGGVCLVAFRSLSAFFFCGAATVGIFGCVVLHSGPWVAVAAALGLLPCLLSFFFRRSLAVPMRVEITHERSRDIPAVRTVRMDETREVKA